MKKEWMKKISKKGVLARKKLREKENKQCKIRLYNTIDRKSGLINLARICGFIMGDGTIDRRKEKEWFHSEIRFYPDNLQVAQIFADTFEYLYSKRPTVTQLKNYYCVRAISKVACDHLLGIGSFSSLEWRIPIRLLSNKKVKTEFIKALFDCEAYIGRRNLQFQSVNKKGIEELRTLLKDMGISASVYEYKRKNPKWNTNYILVISRKENIKRYAKLIGFNHPEKQIKLNILAGVPER